MNPSEFVAGVLLSPLVLLVIVIIEAALLWLIYQMMAGHS